MAVTAKMNMADGVRGGFWLDESVAFARMLEADGELDALTLTGGSSFENPMYLFRGEAPIDEMATMFPGVLKTGIKLFGGRFFKTYPFEEAYFLPYARQFRDALTMPLVLLGGINRLRYDRRPRSTRGSPSSRWVAALLREPEFVAELQKDARRESLCIHCNKCMPTIYTKTRCVLVDPYSNCVQIPRVARDLDAGSEGAELGWGDAEVLLEVAVQVDDPALLGFGDGEVRQARLVHAALMRREVRDVLIEHETERELAVGVERRRRTVSARGHASIGCDALEHEHVHERVVGSRARAGRTTCSMSENTSTVMFGNRLYCCMSSS